MVAPVIVGTNFTLHIVIGQHRVVKHDARLGSVALSLVLVIIDAVDVYDALVVLPGVALDLDDTIVVSRLNLTLASIIE